MQIIIEHKQSKLISGKEIYGVELRQLNEQEDFRGSFTEIFQKHWHSCIEPVQWSFVKSEANVFRGMHLHKRHDEYFCLLDGVCVLGLVDIRPDSPTYGVSSLYELYSDDLTALMFPKGILHGWYFPEKSLHVQAVSEAYIDYGKDDNYGCYWADPALNLPWGVNPEEVIISERARNFPTLETLKTLLGKW